MLELSLSRSKGVYMASCLNFDEGDCALTLNYDIKGTGSAVIGLGTISTKEGESVNPLSHVVSVW